MDENHYSEITPYRRGSRWFQRGSFFYVAGRSSRNSTYMRCASTNCPAKWSIGRGGVVSPVQFQHDHDPTPWIPNRNAMFQALRARSQSETTPLNRIYEEEAARYPDAAPHLLYETVGPSMRGWRRLVLPAVPHSIEDYGFALADHPRHSSLLLATVSAGDGTAIILVMPSFIACLRDSSTIVVDGTFLTVPAGLPANQLLTLHGVVRGHFYHPVVVLMTNRRRVLYETVFRRIWQAAGHPRPLHLVTDYEVALQSALESVTGVQVSGCLFHFVQALLRRARQERIQVGRRAPGWRLVQLYGALAWLPPHQVRLGLAEVPGIARDEGLPFHQAYHEYVDHYWVSQVTPERFSVHGRPHRTSNVAESFHASLRRALGASPNIWRFTDVIAEKFAVSAARLDAQGRGAVPRRNTEARYLSRDRARDRREADFNRGAITLREFLWATALNLDVAIVVANEDLPQVGAEVEIGGEVDAGLLEPELDLQEQVQLDPEVALVVEVPALPPAIPPPPPPPRADHPAQPQQQRPAVCPVCLEQLPIHVLIPCGHVLCGDCRLQLQFICPICRSQIENSIRFYL